MKEGKMFEVHCTCKVGCKEEQQLKAGQINTRIVSKASYLFSHVFSIRPFFYLPATASSTR